LNLPPVNGSKKIADWIGEMAAPKNETIPQVSILVPTYCEAQNLPILIPRITHVLQQVGITCEILIVDDDSPDDTERICQELSQEYPVRALIRKKERGLASAVIHGMRHAQGQYLIVMDADLSHPPEKIPELLKTIQSDSVDFVIGSRYVAGGDTHEDWGVLRWLNSKFATLLARPFTSARDPMAGFFALRRSTFESASRLDPVGYKIALELIVKCNCRNVAEIPIFFHDRLHGESKLSIKEQLNYLRHIGRLFAYKLFGDKKRFSKNQVE
jgi:dolichol-phosphate mannosyltransferase